MYMLLNNKYTKLEIYVFLYITLKVAWILVSPPKNHILSDDIPELTSYPLFWGFWLENPFSYQSLSYNKFPQHQLPIQYDNCHWKNHVQWFYIKKRGIDLFIRHNFLLE